MESNKKVVQSKIVFVCVPMLNSVLNPIILKVFYRTVLVRDKVFFHLTWFFFIWQFSTIKALITFFRHLSFDFCHLSVQLRAKAEQTRHLRSVHLMMYVSV